MLLLMLKLYIPVKYYMEFVQQCIYNVIYTINTHCTLDIHKYLYMYMYMWCVCVCVVYKKRKVKEGRREMGYQGYSEVRPTIIIFDDKN